MASTTTTLLPQSSDSWAAGLTNGTYWSLDSTRTVTWGLANAGTDSWGTDAYSVIADILSNYAEVANIKFSYAGYASDFNKSSANIVFANTQNAWVFGAGGALAWAYFPNESMTDSQNASWFGSASFYPNAAGDVWLNRSQAEIAYSTYNDGSTLYFALLHEIGHALGLKHPHDDGGTGRPTFPTLGLSNLNEQLFTMMSYDESTSVAEWYASYGLPSSVGYPSSLMPMDVIAIQSIYGANTTTRATNTTYSLTNNNKIETYWDAGGIDTLDASLSSCGWFIALGLYPHGSNRIGVAIPGDWGLTETGQFYFNAENLIGSEYEDLIAGDSVSNDIRGKGGDDLLSGLAGNDTIFGNYGNDTSYGGDGNDTINGGWGDDTVYGEAGNDTLDWDPVERGGTDQLAGGIGDDIYCVDSLYDKVIENYGEGTDSIYSGTSYSLVDLPNLENLYAYSDLTNAVLLTGNSQNNYLSGAKGGDTLDGGLGTDYAAYSGYHSNYILTQTASGWTVTASGQATDTLYNIEYASFYDGSLALVNYVPIVKTPIADATTKTGSSISLKISSTTFYDQNNDHLTWSASQLDGNILPAWLSFDSDTLTFSGTPQESDMGSIDIKVTAEDVRESSASDTFRITVTKSSSSYIGSIKQGTTSNNKITGTSGDDRIIGGEGADKLTGGSGADSFVFDNLAVGGADTISDFSAPQGDKLVFDTKIFTSLADGIKASNIVIGAKVRAYNSDDYLLLTTKGRLYYDADGSGSGAAIQVAGIKGSLTGIDYTNFVIEDGS
jgi:serralysin